MKILLVIGAVGVGFYLWSKTPQANRLLDKLERKYRLNLT